MFALCADAGAGRLQRLAGVHVRQPAVTVGRFAVDDVEERRLERLGDRSAPAVADGDLVNRPDGRDLDGGAGEERIGNISEDGEST